MSISATDHPVREVDKGRKSLSVAVTGPVIVDAQVMIRAAVDDVGLAFALEEHVTSELASGALGIDDWCPPFAGYFLLPKSATAAAALAALIDTLRL